MTLKGWPHVTKKLTFFAIRAQQSPRHVVFSFAAPAAAVFEIARIERAGRDHAGALNGFQRPQIASHIHEIRDYLAREDAVLPNSVVLAFTNRVEVYPLEDNLIKVEIDISDGPPGLIVDGQQRLSALYPLTDKHFEVFVSGIICPDEQELRRQFILINNTRPLPKELIYELLPGITELPERMTSRSMASALTQRLNFDSDSSLFGQIHLHTNPTGKITSNALQKVVLASRAHGALRLLADGKDGDDKCFLLVSDFFRAVQAVFDEDWKEHSAKTSRLVHGVGIMAMGRVMEVAFHVCGARTSGEFFDVLAAIRDKTHFTKGKWVIGVGDHIKERDWNEFQTVGPDIQMLSDHLDRLVRQGFRDRQSQGGDENEAITAVA
jgi:DGQHR domain-containing protein